MFISKEEKQLLHENCESLQRQIDALARLIRGESNISITIKVDDIEQRLERVEMMARGNTKKPDTSKYYWKKKAERLANGAKERINKPQTKRAKNVSENANNTSV